MQAGGGGARRFGLGLPAAAVAGFVLGVLATFKAPAGASSEVPYGLVLGLALVVVLVVALRLGLGSRWFGVAGGLGLIAAAGLLALPSAGDSIVVSLDPAGGAVGIVWLVGVVVGSVLAVAVPLPSGRRRRTDGILDADEGTRP